jgi:hypothetical protein
MTVPAYRVTMVCQGWNGNCINVLHVGGATPGGSISGTSTAAIRVFYDAIKGSLATGTAVSLMQVINLSTDPPTYSAIPAFAGIASTGANKSPAEIACCITWRTPFASRSGRGRTFIGPLAAAVVDASSGLLSSSHLSTISTAAVNMLAALVAAGSPLQVYSRVREAVLEVTSVNVNTTPDVLRSRRP